MCTYIVGSCSFLNEDFQMYFLASLDSLVLLVVLGEGRGYLMHGGAFLCIIVYLVTVSGVMAQQVLGFFVMVWKRIPNSLVEFLIVTVVFGKDGAKIGRWVGYGLYYCLQGNGDVLVICIIGAYAWRE